MTVPMISVGVLKDLTELTARISYRSRNSPQRGEGWFFTSLRARLHHHNACSRVRNQCVILVPRQLVPTRAC